MNVLDLNNYPSDLKGYDTSYITLERALKDMRLSFLPDFNIRIEESIPFPPFIGSFYNFVKENNRPPGPIEFINFYVISHRQLLNSFNFSCEELYAAEARLRRLYPSLIRDLHFTLLLKAELPNAKVIFNQTLDIKHDIDVLIEYKGKYYGLILFINTKNATSWREVKDDRHVVFENVEYIEIQKEKHTNKCGDFWLYGLGDIDKVKRKIGY
jgi:hypothetical protein